MGIPAINSLANMEFMLYGGVSGNNAGCPSIYNGYKADPQVNYNQNPYNLFGYNPVFGGYGNSIYDSYNPSYQGINQGIGINNSANTQQTFGANQEDINTLINYHLKGMAPSESLMGAALGGAAFSMMNNPRIIVHPWNSFKATGATNKIFANVVKEGSKLNELWRNEATTGIMQEAYARTHKLEALNPKLGWKFGLFRKQLPETEYNRLKKLMEDALKTADTKKIAKATEEIKRATNAFTGRIPNALRAIGLQNSMTSLRKFINGNQYKPIDDVVREGIEANNKLLKDGKITLTNSLKKSCGIKNGLFFAGMEFLMSWGNIKEAFSKDTSTGMTQLGQTTVKGLGSAAGWAVGEGIGVWAGAKASAAIGAKVGTAIAPGVGTAIGAIAGLVGGSIGMWLTGKITHKLVGTDIGEKVSAQKLAKTPEGQVQLLQMTMQQAQNDKKLDPKTAQAMQNVMNVYA